MGLYRDNGKENGGYYLGVLHSWKLTWKPKRGPIKTTVPLIWGYMDFHASFWECINLHRLFAAKLC